MPKWLNAKKISDTVGEIRIFGYIVNEKWFEEDVTPTAVQEAIDDMGDVEDINVYINSNGGVVFAGLGIYNILKRQTANVTTIIDGVAASISSVIFQAGDKRIMPANTMQLAHYPWTIGVGNAEDFRKLADDLDKIGEPIVLTYLENAKINRRKVEDILTAETWITAKEAVEWGFADEIAKPIKAQASLINNKLTVNGVTFDLSKFKNFDPKKFNIKAFDSPPVVDTPPVVDIPPVVDTPPIDYTETEQAILEMELAITESILK